MAIACSYTSPPLLTLSFILSVCSPRVTLSVRVLSRDILPVVRFCICRSEDTHGETNVPFGNGWIMPAVLFVVLKLPLFLR